VANNVFAVKLGEEELGTFDENELTLEDAFVLENTTGLTFTELLQDGRDGRAKGLQALVWFMRYKQGTRVDLLSINFKLADLTTRAVKKAPSVDSPSPDLTPEDVTSI
jgi:hypothetical protein